MVSSKVLLLMATLFISGSFVSFSVSAEDINLLCVPQHHIYSQLSGKFGKNIECSKFRARYPDAVGCSAFQLSFDSGSSSALYSIDSYKQYYNVKKSYFDYKLVQSTVKPGVGGTERVIRVDRRDLTFSYKEKWSIYASQQLLFAKNTSETGWCIKVEAPENQI